MDAGITSLAAPTRWPENKSKRLEYFASTGKFNDGARPLTRMSRGLRRREPGELHAGSRIASTWFVRTWCKSCLIPLGQMISTSTNAALPVPKCTGVWLEEA